MDGNVAERNKHGLGAHKKPTLPPELAAMVEAEPCDWLEPVLIDKDWVASFVSASRDGNPLHEKSGIVPGIMVLAICDGLLPVGIRDVFTGRYVVIREIRSFRPKRSIRIGQSIQLRYRIAGFGMDPGGLYVTIEVEIRTSDPRKTVMSGVFDFYLLETPPVE